MATYYTTADAASMLGVSMRRVQAMITGGVLAARKRGRDWIISPAALQFIRRGPGRPKKKST